MPHRACVAACVAALSFAARRLAAPPANPAADRRDRRGCFAAGDGYLRARMRGALDLDLTGKTREMQCEGGPRPSGNGVRVSIGGPARGDGRRMRLVFGIAGVGEGRGGETLRTNVTILFEGEQRMFATQGDDKCTVDSLTQQRVETLGAGPRCLSRGGARLLPRAGHQPVARASGCSSPASILQAGSNSSDDDRHAHHTRHALTSCAAVASRSLRTLALACGAAGVAQTGPLEDLAAFPRGKLEISDGKKVKHTFEVWLADTPAAPGPGADVRALAAATCAACCSCTKAQADQHVDEEHLHPARHGVHRRARPHPADRRTDYAAFARPDPQQ